MIRAGDTCRISMQEDTEKVQILQTAYTRHLPFGGTMQQLTELLLMTILPAAAIEGLVRQLK